MVGLNVFQAGAWRRLKSERRRLQKAASEAGVSLATASITTDRETSGFTLHNALFDDERPRIYTSLLHVPETVALAMSVTPKDYN